MNVNLYIANHNRRDGIEDFIAILSRILERRGGHMVVSSEMDPCAVNLIIDGFTNVLTNEDIREFKKRYPDAVVIFVLTEFIERKWFVRSFNFFGSPIEAAVVAVMNVYFRRLRRDFLPPRKRDWVVAALFVPLALLYYVQHRFRNWRSRKPVSLSHRLHRLAYMLMRYQGLEAMIDCADGVILSHALIERGVKMLAPHALILGTLCPELEFEEIKETLMIGKCLGVEITGSVTPHRQKFMNRFNSHIQVLGIGGVFQLCQSISFFDSGAKRTADRRTTGDGDDIRGSRRAYSLHPPQSVFWRYSSPTRIYGALARDHNMPVLTKIFDQHPIEKLALVFRGSDTVLEMYRKYKHREEALAYLEPRVTEYSRIAREKNDAIFDRVATLEASAMSHRPAQATAD